MSIAPRLRAGGRICGAPRSAHSACVWRPEGCARTGICVPPRRAPPRAPASRFAKAGVKAYCRSGALDTHRGRVGASRCPRAVRRTLAAGGYLARAATTPGRVGRGRSTGFGGTASDDGVANGGRRPGAPVPERCLFASGETSGEGSGLRSISAAIWPALASVLAIGTSPAISRWNGPASLH